VPQGLGHQAGHSVKLVSIQIHIEILVEVIDRGVGLDGELGLAALEDSVRVIKVILVLDLTHDLLQHILNGHQPIGIAVLVHYYGHMVAVGAKLSEQHVETLALRYKHGGTHNIPLIKTPGGIAAVGQQVLGQQHADDLALVLIDYRETGVGGVDHHFQDLLQRIFTVDHHHLGTRNHDIPHSHFRYLQHPFHHGERFCIKKIMGLGIFQQGYQLLPVFRGFMKHQGQFFQPWSENGTSARFVVTHLFLLHKDL